MDFHSPRVKSKSSVLFDMLLPPIAKVTTSKQNLLRPAISVTSLDDKQP